MNEQQYHQLDRLNWQISEVGEGLKALGDLIEAADVANAPMPYQLACLVRVFCHTACDLSNRISETLQQIEE